MQTARLHRTCVLCTSLIVCCAPALFCSQRAHLHRTSASGSCFSHCAACGLHASTPGKRALQVQLNKPGSADRSASVDSFVAVGIGILVTEDWLSLGCVQLFKAHEETTVNFKGETVKKWQIAAAYRREFSGPVTAINSSNGNLVLAYSHRVRHRALSAAPLSCHVQVMYSSLLVMTRQFDPCKAMIALSEHHIVCDPFPRSSTRMQVEIWAWTGSTLNLVSQPLPGVLRLVSSLAVIKNEFILAGSTRKGLAFLRRHKDRNTFTLLACSFALADSTVVDFLVETRPDSTQTSFLQADTSGNLALFAYNRGNKTVQDAPGLCAVPLGMYHLAHMVRGSSCCRRACECKLPSC